MATTFENVWQIGKIDANEIRLLWYADFWDGPINGLCFYNNNKRWFEMLTGSEDDKDTAPRRFLVLELSPQQLADEERWHELFRQNVGTHCDYDEPHPAVKPRELHRDFYEAYRHCARPAYSKNPMVGWFEMGYS